MDWLHLIHLAHRMVHISVFYQSCIKLKIYRYCIIEIDKKIRMYMS